MRLAFLKQNVSKSYSLVYTGKVVSNSTARDSLKSYWGYSVRVADTLEQALSEGPFKYDLKIGTSEKG